MEYLYFYITIILSTITTHYILYYIDRKRYLSRRKKETIKTMMKIKERAFHE